MNIENIKRKKMRQGPKININIKVSADISKWLKEKNYSPTGIFYEALKLIDCPCVESDSPSDGSQKTPVEGAHPQSYAAQNNG